jgi:hypothetical protein
MNAPVLPVEPREQITRFLRFSGHFRGGRVRPEGCLPPEPDEAVPRYELSVYRVDNLTPAEIWAIAEAHVHTAATPMKARGTTQASVYIEALLAFDPDGIPHPRHTNVIGWATDKHVRKDQARRIADQMALEERPAVGEGQP